MKIFAKALRMFRQVVQNDPKNAMFHLHLAMALLKQGDKKGAREKAEQELKRASRPDKAKQNSLFR